jgi:N-acetylglutamate synthase
VSAAVTIDTFRPQDRRAALALWSSAGMSIGAAESAEGLAAFLARNPGMSVVARRGDAVVGTVLAGWDGRRGYLHHVAVDPAHRRHGVGRTLVEAAVQRLRAAGAERVHLFVQRDNADALAFWRSLGWAEREDLRMMTAYLDR